MASKKSAEPSNKIITVEFFNSLMNVLAKNTSVNYSVIALEQIKKQQVQKYPFLKEIIFTPKGATVSTKINSVDIRSIGKMFNTLLEILGPNILGELILEKLNPKIVKHLQKFGISFVSEI